MTINRSTIRKIWGDISTRRGRTALMSIAIFIGVLGAVTLVTASDLLVSQLNEDIQPDDLPMAFALVSTNAETPVDNAVLFDDLQALPHMTDVEGIVNSAIYWRDGDRFRESTLWSFTEPLADVDMLPPRLMEGDYPRSGHSELALEVRAAETYDLNVGDTVALRILGNPDAPGGDLIEEWTITGLLFHPYNDQNFREAFFASYEDTTYIASIKGVNIIGGRYETFADAEAGFQTMQGVIADNHSYTTLLTYIEDPEESAIITALEQIAQTLSALGVVAMSVSGFLVINVITNLVVEQRRQIGVMKSLGATRLEIFIIYAGVVLVYGLLGMIPAVLLGMPLGFELAQLIGDQAGTYITDFALSPLGIGLGIVLGIGIPVLAAALPVYNGTRVSILDAMTDLGISAGHRAGGLARFISNLPVSSTVKQSMNNISQKKSRLALTVFTLMLAASAFMGVTAVFVNLDRTIQNVVQVFDWHVEVMSVSTQDYEGLSEALLTNVDEVESVFPATILSVNVEGFVSPLTNDSQVPLLGLDTARDVFQPAYADGTGWDADPDRDGVVISQGIADQVGLSIGDDYAFFIGGEEHNLEIIGVFSSLLDVGITHWETVSALGGITRGAPQPDVYFTGLAMADNAPITAWGIGQETLAFLPLVDGQPATPDSRHVLVSEATGYAVGDEILLNGVAHTVSGVFEPPAELAENGIPAELVALFWRDLATLEGRDLSGEPVPNMFMLRLHNTDPSIEDVDDAIDEINEVLIDNGITATLTNQTESIETVSQTIRSLGVLLNLASLVMAAVGAIGLLTTLSIAVFERQKEIGVMRSVGARSPVIIFQFMIEGVFIGLLAWLIAVPVALVLGYGINDLLPFRDLVTFSYPVILLPIGLLGILIIAAVSSIWPARMAARKTVSEILRYQ